MIPPDWWSHGRTPPWPMRALPPVYAWATAWRMRRPGWTAPVPVICCGNATVGGAGKTPLALDLGHRLQAAGHRVAYLTRGHGGEATDTTRVIPANAATIGDEPQLLASQAPTYVGADRAAAARLAIAEGAEVLIMDDGLQNPTLTKTASLLVIDGGAGFGNGRILPAGPLRESVARAAARSSAAVLIGDDTANAVTHLPAGLPILRARLVPNAADLAALPRRIVAFAGIGRPQKFFDTLTESGHRPLAKLSFPDHHLYTEADLQRLRAEARKQDAALVTTEKDHVRLPRRVRGDIRVLRVGLRWEHPGEIDRLLADLMAGR